MKIRSSYQRGWVEKRTRKSGQVVYLLRWYVRDTTAKNGWKKKSVTLRLPSKKAAFKELEKRMRDVNSTNIRPHRPTTFTQFAQGLWQTYLDNKKRKPSTRYSYDSMLRNHLLPEFGETELGEITPSTVSVFFGKLQNRGLSDQYRLNLYAMLRTMFEVAIEHELIDTHPVRKKLHRPQVEKKEKPTLSPKELRTLLFREIPEYWRVLFITVVFLAVRVGELLALRWSDVDETSQRLHITHGLWRGLLGRPKTKSSRTTLHIPDKLFGMLLQHKEWSAFTQPDDFIFCKEDGSPCDPDYLRKQVLYPAMDRMGIKRTSREFGFHIFRHSAGTIVHKETGDLKLAQRLLRHSNISTTADTYVHIGEEETRRAGEVIAKAILSSYPLIAHSRVSGSDRVQ